MWPSSLALSTALQAGITSPLRVIEHPAPGLPKVTGSMNGLTSWSALRLVAGAQGVRLSFPLFKLALLPFASVCRQKAEQGWQQG